MTKHLYLCYFDNRSAYVLVGWDNNRKGFYMIFDYQNGSEETAIFSNLFSKEQYPKTLDKYIAYLSQQSITLPKQMLDSILRDAFGRVEDNEVTHIMSEGEYIRFESIDYAIL
ncbi:MAG: hypothetical protein KBD64_00420 [Gammaproteobacteria bacterium]|nr:hypothetical protein [Gammaproteobacteria bacterium]